MKKILITILLTHCSLLLLAQETSPSKIFFSDVDNFWIAFDSVHTTNDSIEQIDFIQRLYLNKASEGLKEFMIAKEHSPKRHLQNILKFPDFWTSVRPKTLEIKTHLGEIEKIKSKFKNLYPGFKAPTIYFTIGCLNSGGTTSADKILIGSEIAAATPSTNALELSPWLQGVFKDAKGIMYLVAHEMVHTQQVEDTGQGNLLGNCIAEGAADFIAEILLDEVLITPYLRHGRLNERQVWDNFKNEMYGMDTQNWLYNGNNAPEGRADLGYFMGYAISKSYYDTSKDKKAAIQEILKLNYLDPKQTQEFLVKSSYPKKWK